MVGKALAEEHKQFFEQERRGNDGRACVVPEAVALEDLRPTA